MQRPRVRFEALSPDKLSRPQKRRRRLQLLAAARGGGPSPQPSHFDSFHSHLSTLSEDVNNLKGMLLSLDHKLDGVLVSPDIGMWQWSPALPDPGVGHPGSSAGAPYTLRPEAPDFQPPVDTLLEVLVRQDREKSDRSAAHKFADAQGHDQGTESIVTCERTVATDVEEQPQRKETVLDSLQVEQDFNPDCEKAAEGTKKVADPWSDWHHPWSTLCAGD